MVGCFQAIFVTEEKSFLAPQTDPHDLMITSSKNTELTSDRLFGTRSLHARDHASTASYSRNKRGKFIPAYKIHTLPSISRNKRGKFRPKCVWSIPR